MFTSEDKVLIFAMWVDKGWDAWKNDEQISCKKLEAKFSEGQLHQLYLNHPLTNGH